jgi:hypothetical protein
MSDDAASGHGDGYNRGMRERPRLDPASRQPRLRAMPGDACTAS